MEGQRHVAMEVFQLARLDIAVGNLRIDVVVEAAAKRALEIHILDHGEFRRSLAFVGLARDTHRLRRLECRRTQLWLLLPVQV
jgi:hypothetical protein